MKESISSILTYRPFPNLALQSNCAPRPVPFFFVVVLSAVIHLGLFVGGVRGQESLAEILEIAKSKSAKNALQAGEAFIRNAGPDSTNIEHARVLEFLARFYLKSGEIEMASERIKLAKSICNKTQFHQLLPRVLQMESAIANITGSYEAGIERATEALKLLGPSDPFRGVCLNERAANYSENNEFEKAATDFAEALKLASRANNTKLTTTVQVNLAILFSRHRQHDKSIELLKEALKSAQKLGDRRIKATVLLNLGNDLLSKWSRETKTLDGEKSKVIRNYFDEALKIAGERKYVNVVAECHLGLGDLAADEDLNDEAQRHFDLALAGFQKLKDPKGILGVSTRLLALKSKVERPVSQAIKTQQSIDELNAQLEQALARRDFSNALLILDQLIKFHDEDLTKLTSLLVQKAQLQEQLFATEASAALKKGSTALAVAEIERELEQTVNQVEIGELRLQLEQRNSSIILTVAVGAVLTSIVVLVLWRTKHAMNLELKKANAIIRQEEQKTILMERQLAKQEKMESLSTMSAGVMHDFNNYLSAIIADAEIGIKNDNRSQKNNQFQTVITTAMCAADLTKGLSNYLGSGELHYRSVKIYDLLTQLETVLRSFAPDNLQIDFEHDVPDTVLFVDPNAIRNVLINVVKNAVEAQVDYSPPQVLIEVSNSERDNSPFCELVITDNGSGMSAKVLERATEPFFSTKSVGRGLGLASCKGIIETHDGHFSIYSKEGWGTEVKIQLPIQNVEVLEANSGEEEEDDTITVRLDPTPSGKKKILYVDDDQLVRRAMSSLLSNQFETTFVASAGEAKTELSKTDFDCVIMDYSLSDENGLELAKQIKQNSPDCATILVSGYIELEFEESGDVDVFLSKPFTHATLLSNLESHLSRDASFNNSNVPPKSSDKNPV